MLLVDDLAAGGTKNLRHTPRGLVTLNHVVTKLVVKIMGGILSTYTKMSKGGFVQGGFCPTLTKLW